MIRVFKALVVGAGVFTLGLAVYSLLIKGDPEPFMIVGALGLALIVFGRLLPSKLPDRRPREPAAVDVQRVQVDAAGQAYPAQVVAAPAPAQSLKSREIALVLCLLLGFAGAHRFYVRRHADGVLMLLTFGGFVLIWIVDLISILAGRFKDRDKLPLTHWSAQASGAKKGRHFDFRQNMPLVMLLIYVLIHTLYLALSYFASSWSTLADVKRFTDAIGIYSIGMVIVCGVYWQYLLSFKKDREGGKLPRRLLLTIIICLIFITGLIGRELIAIYVAKSAEASYANLWRLTFQALALSCLLLVKTYFGPIMLTGSLAISSFFLFNSSELTLPALFKSSTEYFISAVPQQFQDIYLIFSILYILGTTFADTFKSGVDADIDLDL